KIWALGEVHSLTTDVRVAALYTYAQLTRVDGMRQIATLTEDSVMAEHALRAMTDRLEWAKDVPVEPYLSGLKSSDERVKMASIIGMGRIGNKDLVEELLRIPVPQSFLAPEFGTEGPHATPNSEIIPAHLAV